MSVPSWNRSTSKAQYLHTAYTLNKDIAHIVASKPKKYQATYGKILINAGLDTMLYCTLANDIFLTENSHPDDFVKRDEFLAKAKVLARYIEVVSAIFLDLCQQQDGENKKTIDKQKKRIGEKAESLYKQLTGIRNYDHKLNRKRKAKLNSIANMIKSYDIAKIYDGLKGIDSKLMP